MYCCNIGVYTTRTVYFLTVNVLLSKDTLNRSKVTLKIFALLPKMYFSNKCCFLELLIHKKKKKKKNACTKVSTNILSSTIVFNIDKYVS